MRTAIWVVGVVETQLCFVPVVIVSCVIFAVCCVIFFVISAVVFCVVRPACYIVVSVSCLFVVHCSRFIVTSANGGLVRFCVERYGTLLILLDSPLEVLLELLSPPVPQRHVTFPDCVRGYGKDE